MTSLLRISLFWLLTQPLYGQGLQYTMTCINPGRENVVLYLHGMEPGSALSAAQQNANNSLAQIALDLGVSIAAPQSKMPCPADKALRCWNVYGAPELLQSLYQNLKEASAMCGAAKQNLKVIIGFSNGGYLTNKLGHFNIVPSDTRLISIGAAGEPPKSIGQMKDFPPLTLILAKGEKTYPSARLYFDALSAQDYPVSWVEYTGVHGVPYETTKSVLEKELQKIAVPRGETMAK